MKKENLLKKDVFYFIPPQQFLYSYEYTNVSLSHLQCDRLKTRKMIKEILK